MFTLGMIPAAIFERNDLIPIISVIGYNFGTFASADPHARNLNKTLLLLILAGAFNLLTISFFVDVDKFSPPQKIALSASSFILYGIWLIVRQWTWGEWVAWVVPLVATLLLSSFAGAAPVLHAWYAEKLSVSAADLEVPGLWQVASAVKLLSILTFLLIFPATWGVAHHFHFIRSGERFNLLLYMTLLSTLLMGCGFLAAESAEQAASRTALAAKQGTPAPPYFGVKPEWTCVIPVAPSEGIPSEGGRLNVRRAYLSLGSSSGQVLLLEPGSAKPIKIPTARAVLIPVTSTHKVCQ
ncbi:hypothetical protein [Streptomyces sp. HB2AG]|uniref:hypothetical protein n=1 Tax=Streptomyces sp. HB2AG TaxID=2983400 RepID=UPI0022AAB7CC|nr:hypothetical protein [Streptomyces sp. HB2AG]MCZ2525745.1 hypothetical protein [Streptomyces sp. HB2AG]